MVGMRDWVDFIWSDRDEKCVTCRSYLVGAFGVIYSIDDEECTMNQVSFVDAGTRQNHMSQSSANQK